MKKLIVAILSFVYLTTSTGATINLHYCMGKLADWNFGHDRSKTCSKCGMEKDDEKDNGCCKDEHKFIKNQNDQKNAEVNFSLIKLTSTDIQISIVSIPARHITSLIEENPISKGPPRSSSVAVYLLDRTFLI